jgi:integrase
MSKSQPNPRRVREPGERNANIYRRYDAKFELGYRDSSGKQRWEGRFETISAARKARDERLGHRAEGKLVRSNPRLTFGAAADAWLRDQVADLRPATRASYAGSVRVHLKPRWGKRRLDRIGVTDAVRLIRELRAEGKSEATIETICKAARRTFRFAARHMNWRGESPFDHLENGERPKLSEAPRRRIFEGDELAQTIAAAWELWRTLFTFAAVTGCRLSEALGLVWADLDLSDLDSASVSFAFQVDRKGKRQPLKTDESRRELELPRSLAVMLAEHKARSLHSQELDFVFASRAGRALSQRNVLRALRAAMGNARAEDGSPTFPALHAVDPDGKPLPVPRGSVPSFHALRHTAASQAIRDGESAEEVSWQLGHKSSVVTRSVYIRELRDAERSVRRRAKFEARIGDLLAVEDQIARKQELPENGRVVDLDFGGNN